MANVFGDSLLFVSFTGSTRHLSRAIATYRDELELSSELQRRVCGRLCPKNWCIGPENCKAFPGSSGRDLFGAFLRDLFRGLAK